MKNGKLFLVLFVLMGVGSLSLVSCKKHNNKHKDHDHGAHVHKPKFGGTLVEIGGDHFAHLEFVLDGKKGTLTAYVLDGHAEPGPQAEQQEVEVKVTPAGKKKETITLKLVGTNPVGKEKLKSYPQFQGQSDKLKGVKAFKGVVTMVKVKGKELKKIAFDLPKKTKKGKTGLLNPGPGGALGQTPKGGKGL